MHLIALLCLFPFSPEAYTLSSIISSICNKYCEFHSFVFYLTVNFVFALQTTTNHTVFLLQVRSLKVENDQMCSVIGEKSREISTLKKQVHSLMEANTSRDNRTSEQDDMSKQTIR